MTLRQPERVSRLVSRQVARRTVVGRLLGGGAAVVGVAALARQRTAAQVATPVPEAPHPLVGSWAVQVVVEGQPQLVLPNLTAFTADGIVLVAAPPYLPELPGATAPIDSFSGGHGAWQGTGGGTAEVRFAFLVSAADGSLASINTVHGTLEVAMDGSEYAGTFTLDIVAPDGGTTSSTGFWDATRIDATSTEPVSVPLG